MKRALALAVLLLPLQADASPSAAVEIVKRETDWTSGRGDWTDAARWSAGVPDALSRVKIRGRSEVRLLKQPGVVGVGVLDLGSQRGDHVRLEIAGGELVSRRDYIHLGEDDDSSGEIVLEAGAMHVVSAAYIGGWGVKIPGACRGEIRIRGGSFVGRQAILGWGQRAEAVLAIEGSRPAAVHLLDYVTMGVSLKGFEPSTSTLAFTLDEFGVTPITIQSRKTGLRISRTVPENRCRLQVTLSAVPPRDDVTLVAAHVRPIGIFDDLPEGSEIVAEHAGRSYRWTLTYRGGENGCAVALTKVRGHAEDAPVTKCRSIPSIPIPLWETLPARSSGDRPDALLAFDGAEGFGRHAAGGRGGSTLWVENLNDAGPGSFRAAAQERGARIVNFRVGGTIPLKTPLVIAEPFITVNGQSAPAGGITFIDEGFVVQTHDVILRHFRIRPGDATDETDALSIHDAERCIVDHLSLSWGTDEVLSVTGLSDAITIQWCIISEGLNLKRHGYASIAAGERVTWHHNLFAHHISRVPRFANIVRADFRNNVLYNWGHTAGYGAFERVNYVANYLKPGPSTTQRPLLIHKGEETVVNGSLHLAGNVMHGNETATRDNATAVGFERGVLSAKPFSVPPVRTETAPIAYERVLSQAGALPEQRDVTDTRVVREVRTGTGRVINTVSEIKP